MSSVYKQWFLDMPWKMQSILSNGLRATDVKTVATKKCVRWMRTVVCNDADPTKPDCYMSAPPMTQELIEACVDELEYLTGHYIHHLADAMRVVALYYEGADQCAVRRAAHNLHFLIAEEIFHFVPESDETFIWRHRDKVAHD
jgi:hypothetical protein